MVLVSISLGGRAALRTAAAMLACRQGGVPGPGECRNELRAVSAFYAIWHAAVGTGSCPFLPGTSSGVMCRSNGWHGNKASQRPPGHVRPSPGSAGD